MDIKEQNHIIQWHATSPIHHPDNLDSMNELALQLKHKLSKLTSQTVAQILMRNYPDKTKGLGWQQ